MTSTQQFVAGGDWLVPEVVGIGGYTVVTDADAAEILNDKDASPADTYYVNDQAFLQFGKEGEVTAARMLDFRFNEQLLTRLRLGPSRVVEFAS